MSDVINVVDSDGELVVSSREVAENFGKDHKHILEGIRNIESNLSTAEFSTLFNASKYKASNGKANVEYLLTRDGFSLLVMGFTGKKAIKWKMKYIEAFNAMEAKLKQVLSPTDRAMLNLINADGPLDKALAIRDFKMIIEEPLKEEIDRYQRFLGENMETITKTELAHKLDVKPQTLASRLKKHGVYTKTSQVSAEFLRRFKDTTIIKPVTNVAYRDRDGNDVLKKNWVWTYDGAKNLIDFLIDRKEVVFSENNGFKLIS